MDEKIVISQFTDMDKNIEALADVSAECKFRMYAGYCTSCDGCETKSMLDTCYNALSLCSRLRVDSISDRMFVTRAARYTVEKDRRRRERRGLRVLTAFFIVIVLVSVKCLFFPADMERDDKIRRVLDRAHSQVKDVNGDGLVNCVDYAVVFKRQWDLLYAPDDCEIVRNVNMTPGSDFNHLFVRCRIDGTWAYVEPQAGKDEPYDMYGFWYKVYNDKYGYDKTESRKYGYNMFWNRYGETEYWLGQIKQEAR